MSDRKTIHEFVRNHKIRMTCKWADRNPHMDADLQYPMDHWRCRLTCGRKSMTVHFSMGMGHSGREPTVEDVLNSLASDASGIAGRDFEEWAGDYGYDADSRKAHKTYKAIEKQAIALKKLLGEDALNELFYETEQL